MKEKNLSCEIKVIFRNAINIVIYINIIIFLLKRMMI